MNSRDKLMFVYHYKVVPSGFLATIPSIIHRVLLLLVCILSVMVYTYHVAVVAVLLESPSMKLTHPVI